MTKKNNNGDDNGDDTVNIRPTAGYLTILAAINYREWYALAEFVDNSIQSYVEYKKQLKKINGDSYKLRVDINVESDRIIIKDNAAGIDEKNYPRAFRAAARPERTSGLSEFGMGMKTAACWFSPKWSVLTKPINEDYSKTVEFDLKKITKDSLDELKVDYHKVKTNKHFTIIVLNKLRRRPKGATIMKIREHLSSMYRCFIRNNEFDLYFNNKKISFKEPPLMIEPDYRDIENMVKNPKPKKWKKNINITWNKMIVKGFVGIRNPASLQAAGFALFRRKRLIMGSASEAMGLKDTKMDGSSYRPLTIFKAPNSFEYQRIFGELHFDDIEVSHTKDGFVWTPEEEWKFLQLLKKEMDSEELPIIQQARRFRKERNTKTLRQVSKEGHKQAIDKLPQVLEIIEKVSYKKQELPKFLDKGKEKEVQRKTVNFEGRQWSIEIILNYDRDNSSWLLINDDKKIRNKQIQIQISMLHPFTEMYFGDNSEEVEGMILIGSYIALAETIARERGNPRSDVVRSYLNDILAYLPPPVNKD